MKVDTLFSNWLAEAHLRGYPEKAIRQFIRSGTFFCAAFVLMLVETILQDAETAISLARGFSALAGFISALCTLQGIIAYLRFRRAMEAAGWIFTSWYATSHRQIMRE